MPEHLQPRPVGPDAQVDPPGPDAPVVAFEARLVVVHVRRAAGVDASRPQRPARRVGGDVRPGVAGVEEQAPARPGRHRVEAVVVVEAAKASQERLALVGLVVAVGVGVDEEVRRGRDVDLVANDADAQRRHQVVVLHEGLGGVGAAVAVGVLHDHDTLAGRVRKMTLGRIVEVAVVDRFKHPEAPFRVHVDVGGVVEHRRVGPESRLQPVGHVKALGGHGVGAHAVQRGGGSGLTRFGRGRRGACAGVARARVSLRGGPAATRHSQ